MDFKMKTAQEKFFLMMQDMMEPELRKTFLTWIYETWMKGSISSDLVYPPVVTPSGTAPTPNQVNFESLNEYNDGENKLRKISDDIRELVPLNAILPSEQIAFPTVGENADCDPSHTLHVDAFLYDEDMIDELCDTGELARNYCVDCSSHSTQPITYLSHSCSRERLTYIFRALLPPIPENSTILDVGSRLGAVLFGAYVHTKCKQIVGVEINRDFCQVQQTIVNKYQFQDRIKIMAGDIMDHGPVVSLADVIILHNVFEFFMPPHLQARIWCFLKATTKKGSLIVSIPALQDSIQYLDIGFRLGDWVQEIPPSNPNITAPFDFQTETSEVKLYQVL